MPRLSIIFGYRNRDTLRVKRCLDSLSQQSFKDFDVIFIDYGSDDYYSKEIKPVVESYSFTKYYYSFTQGYPWNRSHALNTGVRLTDSEYILFGDIDLIYSERVIESLLNTISDNIQVYSSVYFLNKRFNQWDLLDKINLQSIKKSDDSGRGGVHLIKRDVLEKIRGYDEFYCFWGVEDRDLYSRLDILGVESRWIDSDKHPVFHQWHQMVSNRKKNFFPEKWWDEVNIYYQTNKVRIERNKEDWGKLFSLADRPIYNAHVIPYKIPFCIKSYQKADMICQLIDSIQKLNKGEALSIEFNNTSVNPILNSIIKYSNIFSRMIHFPIGLDFICNVEKELYSYPQNEILFIIWYLVKREQIISDYSIINDREKIRIKIMAK